MVSSLESNSSPRIISDINHSSQWNGALHAGIQPVYHQLLFFRHKKCLEAALIGAAQRFDFNFTLNYFWHVAAIGLSVSNILKKTQDRPTDSAFEMRRSSQFSPLKLPIKWGALSLNWCACLNHLGIRLLTKSSGLLIADDEIFSPN